MKCKQCGYESEQSFSACPGCGAQAQSTSSVSVKILPALKDPLFLVLCILMTISCLFAMAADSFSVINILLTVFLWLTYASARKDKVPTDHLRFISGTLFAQYVILFVAAGLCLLMGVIFAIAFNTFFSDPAYIESLLSGFITSPADLQIITEALGMLSGGTLLVVMAMISILITLINIFSMRYFHGFAQSVYKNLESGTALKYVTASRVWLIICAIGNGISVVSTILGSTADVSLGITSANLGIMIVCILLLNKYLSPEELS